MTPASSQTFTKEFWKLIFPLFCSFFFLENHYHGTRRFASAENQRKETRRAGSWRTVTANLRTAWPTKSLLR